VHVPCKISGVTGVDGCRSSVGGVETASDSLLVSPAGAFDSNPGDAVTDAVLLPLDDDDDDEDEDDEVVVAAAEDDVAANASVDGVRINGAGTTDTLRLVSLTTKLCDKVSKSP
jgi:hypothetical protein